MTTEQQTRWSSRAPYGLISLDPATFAAFALLLAWPPRRLHGSRPGAQRASTPFRRCATNDKTSGAITQQVACERHSHSVLGSTTGNYQGF